MSRAKLVINSLRQALSQALGLDNKRKRAWCEYGYKDTLDFHDLYGAYRRHSIAKGAIKKVVGRSWVDYPEIYRGSKAEEDQIHDSIEIKINKMLDDRFWREFKEADRRRLIGRWSALILYFNDGHEVTLADPVSGDRVLRKVKAAWCTNLTPLERDESGGVVIWSYQPPSESGQPVPTVNIHSDRVFILGDMSADGESLIEGGFNNLVNIEKIEGGSAESYLKNASRQIHLNYDPEAEVMDLSDESEKDKKTFRQQMNELAKDLNEGNDTVLITQGATANPLVANVPDPTQAYMINIQSFSASVDIPFRILIGSQSGERASTEDWKQFNGMIQGRREADLSIEILDLVYKLIGIGIIESDEYGVTWSDLTVPTKLERLEVADKMVDINQKLIYSGEDEVAFSREEVRSEAGFDTSTNNSSI